MRKILFGAGIAVIALLAAAVTYLALIDVNQFRPQIQAAIQKQLGRPVSLGTMSLRIIPLSIRIADVSVGEDPAFNTGRPFATASQVRVAVSLLPLLRKQLHIASFVLREPAIELVRNSGGKWNFATIGGGAGGGEGGGGLSIAELRVEEGKVAVSELGKKRSVYDHIGITLSDFAPGRPFRLALAAALPGTSGESLRLEATGGPLEQAQPPFKGYIEVRKAGIAALRQFLSAGAAAADGVVDGRVDFELKNSVVSAQPRLAIEKVKVGGKDLGRSLRIEGDLQHNLDTGVLRTPGLRLAAGDVPVAISGEVDTRNSRMDVTARATNAPVSELLAAAAAFGGTPITGSGRLDLDLRVRGPLDRVSEIDYAGQAKLRDAALSLPALAQPLNVPSANLKLAGKSAAVEGLVASLAGSTLRGGMTVRDFAAAAPSAGFDLEVDKLDFTELQKVMRSSGPSTSKTVAVKKPMPKSAFSAKGTLRAGKLIYTGLVLEQVRSECSFADNVLTLSPLTAEVFGGKQTGAITVDMRSEPIAVAMNTKLESVDADRLLTATTSLKSALYGLLAASGNASMKLLPGTGATQSLNGDLAIRLTKGRLGGINVMNQLAGLGKFVGFAQQSKPFTDIVGLTGDVQVREGIAKTENLLVQMDTGSLGAAGTVNLVDESLNLRVTAVLDSATSQIVGGSRVGGYLTSALVNNKGEMVIPAIVTGTFAKPRFAPDAARVAEMKLKNVLPAGGNLGTAASGVVGMLKGDKSAAKSILQSLTGKQEEKAKDAPEAAPPPETAPKRKGLFGALDALKERTRQPAPAKPASPEPAPPR